MFTTTQSDTVLSQAPEAKLQCDLPRSRDGLCHNAIAKYLMEKYKGKYCCASIKHNIWYKFKNHRWVKDECGYSLRNLMSDELVAEYINLQMDLQELIEQCGNKSTKLQQQRQQLNQDSMQKRPQGSWEVRQQRQQFLKEVEEQQRSNEEQQQSNEIQKQQWTNELRMIPSIISLLKDPTFKNGVISECADITYVNFPKNLDENINLICFENGVFDLSTFEFRDGRPDDYISKCVGYDFPECDKIDEYYPDVKIFFQKIQPDKTIRKFLKTVLSTCLSGASSEQVLFMLIGSCAGITTIMKLMEYTLGDLFKSMHTGLPKNGNISKNMRDIQGVRMLVFDKPGTTNELDTGLLKILTTRRDSYTWRRINGEPVNFRPQFKPFWVSNYLPNINPNGIYDDNVWQTFCILHFPSKFIKMSNTIGNMKENSLDENQKPMVSGVYEADVNLSEVLPKWRKALMSMLIKYYKKYKQTGLIWPDLVKQYTLQYRKQCAVFLKFIDDCLERTGNTNDSVSYVTLYQEARKWCGDYDKLYNLGDLRSYMLNKMPSFSRESDSLIGYRFLDKVC